MPTATPPFRDFKSVFMASPGSYLAVLPDAPRFTILTANDAFLKVTMTSREQIVGRGMFEVFPDDPNDPEADGVERCTVSLHRVLATKQPDEMPLQKYSIQLPESEGGHFEQLFWRPMNIPILDSAGEVKYILHRTENVTKRVTAERDRNRFVDIASDLLVKVGFDGRFYEVNSACESILGWTQQEMMSRSFLDFVYEKDVADTRDALNRMLRGEELNHFENRYRCKDGNLRWLSWHTRTYSDERIAFCAASDITQVRRIRSVTDGQKQALEMSVHGEPLSSILAHLATCLEENADSGARASILLLSEDKTRLELGAAPSLPDAWKTIIDGMTIGDGRGSCGRAALTGEVQLTPDIAADSCWEEVREQALSCGLRACWSSPIITGTGELIGTFSLYYDHPRRPTENEQRLVEMILRKTTIVIERERHAEARRRFEEQLIKARNDAEAASVAKSEFLANMSHEIRTPMNVVIGIADILSQHEQLTETQAELVRTLARSADGLMELIDDLLDLSRIEAQSIELERVAFSFSRLLEGIESMMSQRAASKGLRFVVRGLGGGPDRFIGDPTRIRQIVLNLLSNAIKFTHSGEVCVTVTKSSAPPGHAATISLAVRDTGIGIEPENIQSIFNKFTQADSSINRKYGGTGLGLSITRKLVEIMDGQIRVKSKPGRGSTFTVLLPLTVAPLDMKIGSPAAPNPAAAAERYARVLLVEDFEPNAIITGRYLRVFGYNYDVARNGFEAVECVKKGDYAAILMDVQMPEMDGIEASRRIRQREVSDGCSRIPIIAMTAHALVGDRERCLEAGMDDYLSKPFKASELEQKLRTVFA